MTLQHLVSDLRYSWRSLMRQPLFVLAAVASIAVGVGANSTVFAIAREFLLATPTTQRPDRLVNVRMSGNSHVSYRQWQALQESGALAGFAGYQIEREVNWRNGDHATSLVPLIVTANFFDLLGVPVAMGRGFTAVEAAAEGDPRVAVVSHGFWQRRLGGDPAIVGRAIVLNGAPYTILGVLPANLRAFPGFAVAPEVYLPLSRSLMSDLNEERSAAVQLVGRLRDDQAIGDARAALTTVGQRFATTYGWRDFGRLGQFSPITEGSQEFGNITTFFTLLLVVVGLVLAIACANVAGLLLARSTERRREIALRLALGAGRGRLVQQLLTESLWLAVVGSAAGLLLMMLIMQAIASIPLPLPLPLELRVSWDARLVMYALLLLVLTTIFTGLAPALRATKPSLVPALKDATLHVLHRRWTLRGLLVMGQVAVSLVLLVTAFLFLRNLARTHALDPGFDTQRTLVAQVSFVEGRHTRESHETLLQTAADRLRSTPGLESASFAMGVPLTIRSGRTTGTEVSVEGTDRTFQVRYEDNNVGPGYFATMGIPLVKGRDFNASDRRGAPQVILINEEFARRHLAGLDPIGVRVMLPGANKPEPAAIIGVVGNSKHRMLGEAQQPAIYHAYLQTGGRTRFVHVLARASAAGGATRASAASGASATVGDAEGLKRAIERVIGDLDPTAAVDVQTMRTTLAFAFLPSQVGAGLLGSLAALGLVLAMAGLFAMMSYAVTRRTREIGIRMALGATRQSVTRLVIRDAALLVGTGAAIGLATAAFVTRPLSMFLVAGLSASDPVSFFGTTLVLMGVTIAASWAPVRRATRIEPAVALRDE